jgi:hypothetical protein
MRRYVPPRHRLSGEGGKPSPEQSHAPPQGNARGNGDGNRGGNNFGGGRGEGDARRPTSAGAAGGDGEARRAFNNGREDAGSSPGAGLKISLNIATGLRAIGEQPQHRDRDQGRRNSRGGGGPQHR